MSTVNIEDILHEIDLLTEDDRLELQRRLARRFEEEWQSEASTAAGIAQHRQIDQARIDQAIENLRYGRT